MSFIHVTRNVSGCVAMIEFGLLYQPKSMFIQLGILEAGGAFRYVLFSFKSSLEIKPLSYLPFSYNILQNILWYLYLKHSILFIYFYIRLLNFEAPQRYLITFTLRLSSSQISGFTAHIPTSRTLCLQKYLYLVIPICYYFDPE